MKLPLRYFLLITILLGAVGLPWAWRTYHARRERRTAEIRRLERELGKIQIELHLNTPDLKYGESPLRPEHITKVRRRVARLNLRGEEIENRLEALTGKGSISQEAKNRMLKRGLEEGF